MRSRSLPYMYISKVIPAICIYSSYLCGGRPCGGRRDDVVLELLVNCAHHGVGAVTAGVAEVVHVGGPDHAAAVAVRLDEVRLELQAVHVLVADPLVVCGVVRV